MTTMTTLLLLALLSMLCWLLGRRPGAERVLVIGSTPLARQLVDELTRRGRRVAVVTESDAPDAWCSPLSAGSLAQLPAMVADLEPDRIVVALADRRGRLPMRELLEARVQGIAVEDGVACYESLTGKIAIEALTPSGLIASPDFRKSHLDLAFGHALSLVVSFGALVALAPLAALIACAIKLESDGPVFFVQERIGHRGRRMRLLKFRTMRPASARTSEWVRDNDHRITKVGRWLRRFRLDELPQLVNVLRGEMNLVGPRPHPMSNAELFTAAIPYYSLRSVVRPGLTGWAQVRQGYANTLEEEIEKMRYDLYYIKHMSAWLDLRILLQTVTTVVFGRGCASAIRQPAAVVLTGPTPHVGA